MTADFQTMDDTVAPATFDALGSTADWRDRLHWPSPFSGIAAPLKAVYQRYLTFTEGVADPDLRNVLLLGRQMMPTLTLVQYAHWTHAGQKAGIRLAGSPLFGVLAGRTEADAAPNPLPSIGQPPPPQRFRWPRRLARTKSWTSWAFLPKAMFRPDGIALNHNALLRDHLRRSPLAIRNGYEDDFAFDAHPADDAFLKAFDFPGLADSVLDHLTGDNGLPDEINLRLRGLLRPTFIQGYADGARLLGGLRASPRLPSIILSGTGSKPMSRALGLEIMRRGGEAVRCDHGGSHILLNNPEACALNELSVSTSFVTATAMAATSASMTAAQRAAANISKCKIIGGHGDSSLDVGASALSRNTRPQTGRRRVMYVSTLFYGLHQVAPPTMPAPLYLDWQWRLIEMLKTMPVDLACKPHPGGLRPPSEWHISRLAPISAAPFEQAVADADVLIYDFPATTTLAVGLCTDRPIVLIDHGTMDFSPSLRSEIEARCRFVRADYDDRNRPLVARAELEAAVCDGEDVADPSFFRRLLLGT